MRHQQTATQITLEASGQAAEYVLAAPVELKLNTGYQRSLKQGSRWLRVGRVPQREVYKPYMDVFTVEGAHIHEAYLVVDGSQLVGFYLPAERSYTNLDQRVQRAASGPKYSEQQAATPTLKADQGRVYFYRSSMFGAAIQPAIALDGKEVGKSQPGGYFYVDTTAGSHEASASTEATNKLTFVLDKGETKYVRTSPQLGILAGRIVPELVNADESKKELPDLSYTGQTR